MRVIRPEALTTTGRRRPLLMELAAVGATSAPAAAVMGGAAAIGLGVGSAWLMRVIRPDRTRRIADALVSLLGATFDDSYTLVVAPRLPVRDAMRLDGILVGPGGIRILTARDWEGRYRVRGRVWEFDARGRRGWIRCRTNPSFDATALADGVTRWAKQAGLPDLPLRPVVAFPYGHSRIVLEEPVDEVLTSENAPWWANTIGRVRRIDAPTAARVLEAVLDAADGTVATAATPVAGEPR
jgi:hypothetical protein